MTPSPPRGLKFALEIASLGYRVMPVSWPKKIPILEDWPNKASSDVLEIADMWADHPRAIVGVATGPVLAIDMDEKDGKHGISAWVDWCREAGIDVPDLAQKTLSGGAHALYMLPGGEELGNSSGPLPKGVDVRGFGGYIVAYDVLPHSNTLPLAPDALIQALRAPEKRERRSGDVTVRDPALGVHPYAQRAISYELDRLDACAREEADLWNNTTYEVACNLIEFANSAWSGYELEMAYYDHHFHAPQDAGFGEREIQKCWESALAKIGDGDREEPEGNYRTAQEAFDVWEEKDLKHRIFDASPTLQHIRQAAHSRMLGDGAVLASVLGRVLAAAPPWVVLPPTIGSVASLNLGFAIVGDSGDGKSATFKLGAEILGINQKSLETGVGSGEGLIEAFLEEQKVPDPRDPTKMILQKTLVDPPSRILNVDEVEHMTKASGRDGSTLMSILRTALTGGALKSANASVDRRRSVESETYRLVTYIGVQPALSGALLNEADAGTPQRLLWIWAVDKTLPKPKDKPDWPGSLDWPSTNSVELIAGDYHVKYPDHVADMLLEQRWERGSGRRRDPLESHMMLTRLKVAAALAFLHNEVNITDQWWTVSGYLMEWSKKAQDQCRAILGEKGKQIAQQKGSMSVVEEDAAEKARMDSVKQKILGLLGKDGITWGVLRNKLTVRQQELFEHAVENLVSAGSVSVEVSEYNGNTVRRLHHIARK